jgi:hypothetical protein
MELMLIELEDFLGLELQCYYSYEPAVPEDDINPPEQAVVQLEKVYLGVVQVQPDKHLKPEQWKRLEQEIYDRIEKQI